MEAAVLKDYGSAPEFGEFEEPGADGLALVEVGVAGLNPVDRTIASGSFDAEKIERFEQRGAPVDSYGVGSALLRGDFDFTADVVELDGRPGGKVGRELRPNPRRARSRVLPFPRIAMETGVAMAGTETSMAEPDSAAGFVSPTRRASPGSKPSYRRCVPSLSSPSARPRSRPSSAPRCGSPATAVGRSSPRSHPSPRSPSTPRRSCAWATTRSARRRSTGWSTICAWLPVGSGKR